MEEALSRYENEPSSVSWLCYEMLHTDPHASLKSIIRFLELDENCIDINKAIKNNSFEARKKAGSEMEWVFATRKGKVGSGSKELLDNTQVVIDKKANTLYKRAYSLCLKNL